MRESEREREMATFEWNDQLLKRRWRCVRNTHWNVCGWVCCCGRDWRCAPVSLAETVDAKNLLKSYRHSLTNAKWLNEFFERHSEQSHSGKWHTLLLLLISSAILVEPQTKSFSSGDGLMPSAVVAHEASANNVLISELFDEWFRYYRHHQ